MRLSLSKQDYVKYLRTPHWRRMRTLAFYRYGKKCRRCGNYGTNRNPIQVHHRSYDHLGDERIEELEVICKNCHTFHHQEK